VSGKRKGNEVFEGQRASMAPRRDVLKDDFDFEIPTQIVPLPSGGVIYPVDSVMYGKNEVAIKSMTAKEEDILTSRALIKKGTVITELLRSAILDDGFDPDIMLSGDRNAIMITLRATGYGPEYKVEVDCPACSNRSKQSFNLAELPIKELEISPVATGANLFETELPMTKKKVRFKFLTGNDEREISVTQERKKKQGNLVDNMVTTRLLYQIVSIDDISDKTKIGFFVRAMPARDSLHLRKYIDNHEPGIDMKAWMDCPACYETSEVRLPLGATFFWPDSE
jgi:hypothetical protein